MATSKPRVVQLDDGKYYQYFESLDGPDIMADDFWEEPVEDCPISYETRGKYLRNYIHDEYPDIEASRLILLGSTFACMYRECEPPNTEEEIEALRLQALTDMKTWGI